MRANEIFAELKRHMLEGMVFHDMMCRYYGFLALDCFADKHEKRYYDETEGYRRLCSYYMCHYDRFIPETRMEQPEVIPESWYRYRRQDVDQDTRISGLKTGTAKWIEWEQKTKELYEQMCKELYDTGEMAAARFVLSFVEDVDNELKDAENEQLRLEAMSYDLSTILS